MPLPAPARLAERLRELPFPNEVDWYQLGDQRLGLRTDIAELRERFASRYADCVCSPGTENPLEYAVRMAPGEAGALVTVSGGELTGLEYAFPLYAPDGYRVTSAGAWRLVTPAGAPAPTMALSRDEIIPLRGHPWQRFLANLAINHALGLQRHALFFHGASVVLGGRGVVLLGPKGSGKTTLSMALAARGHAFNGDEVAGVDTRDRTLIPVPRVASVREGPAAEAVRQALAGAKLPVERLPDGSVRRRVRVASLFPASTPTRAPLHAIVVLGPRSEAPEVEEFAPSWRDLPGLAPLACTLWGDSPQARVIQLLRFLGSVRCIRLTLGSPDSTAQLIENTVTAE